MGTGWGVQMPVTSGPQWAALLEVRASMPLSSTEKGEAPESSRFFLQAGFPPSSFPEAHPHTFACTQHIHIHAHTYMHAYRHTYCLLTCAALPQPE